jgi:hypothetical protein
VLLLEVVEVVLLLEVVEVVLLLEVVELLVLLQEVVQKQVAVDLLYRPVAAAVAAPQQPQEQPQQPHPPHQPPLLHLLRRQQQHQGMAVRRPQTQGQGAHRRRWAPRVKRVEMPTYEASATAHQVSLIEGAQPLLFLSLRYFCPMRL